MLVTSSELFVTIIVPALNEERYIASALNSLICQNHSFEYEILVMDGGSTDATAGIVEMIAGGNSRIRLVKNEKRLQAAAVNLGARIADPRSSFILRADCHALYPDDFIASCIHALIAHEAKSVVVPMKTVGFTCFQKAVAAAQNSGLGNGNSAHRQSGRSGYIDHGHHAAFDRAAFMSVGGYDESFSHNEDAELDFRLVRAGYKIWLNGDAPITYFPRSSISSLATQYFKYGNGRARTVLKHSAPIKSRQLLPVAVFIACLISIASAILYPSLLLFPLLYLAICLLWGLLIAIRERDACVLFSGVASVTMHMSWAAGYLSRRLHFSFEDKSVGASSKAI